jgi:hypothetical protein
MTSCLGINRYSTNIPSIRDRLNARINIDETTGCWNWTSTKNRSGYGVIHIKKTHLAHRLSYQEYHPLTTDISNIDLFVCHKCIGNTGCINPDHLYLGTPQDNTDDIREQGRSPDAKGEKNNRSFLTEKDVLEIRELYSAGGYSSRKIGDMYGVTKQNIFHIVKQKSWKHI